METSDFKELFNYNHTVRQNYIDVFKKTLSWEDMVKNHETGWLSLKDTLLHIIWVEDSWINYSIQGLEDPNRPFPYSNYTSWRTIDYYNSSTALKIDNYLSLLRPDDLCKRVSRINQDGIKRNTQVKDVLIHVIAEELHHRGEIIAILWQMNIHPPDMGWLSIMKNGSAMGMEIRIL
ncbi:MAG: DinB family protein [Nitrososphaeraceae archaeon]